MRRGGRGVRPALQAGGRRFEPGTLHLKNAAGNGRFLVARMRDEIRRIGQNVYVVATAACECRRTERHLALIEEAVAAVREAERLLPDDEHLREEERLLLDLRARITERLAVLAA